MAHVRHSRGCFMQAMPCFCPRIAAAYQKSARVSHPVLAPPRPMEGSHARQAQPTRDKGRLP